MFNQHCLLCDYLGPATQDVLTCYLGFTELWLFGVYNYATFTI